jgi:putative ABC transport system permease protein
METLFQDIRFGIRMLMRSPRFAAIALVVLALGIGATTAIVSLASVALLRPLPFPNPDRLAWLYDVQPQAGETPASFPEFLDFRDRNDVFESVAAFNRTGSNLTGTGDPVRLISVRVTADFFKVLGISPQIGRAFLPEENTLGANKVAILSKSLWQQRFAGATDVLGKPIELDGTNYTIVGVLESKSGFLSDADILVPLPANPATMPRGLHFLGVVARLKPGVKMQQASANMNTVAEALQKQYSTDHGIKVISLREYLFGDVRPILLVFLGAVAFVLLIAWANVANLQMVRATARQREIAVRVAVGAHRLRLIRQFLTESVLLSAIGGALGIAVAYGGLPMLVAFSPESARWVKEAKVDGQILLFAFAISLLTGAVFGLIPALQGSKPNVSEYLKEGAKSSTGTQGRVRNILVVSEVALALILLVGAGLTLKSFSRLMNTKAGFNFEKVLSVQVSLPASKYKTDSQQAGFYKDVLERVSALPEVQSASIINSVPLSGQGTNGDVGIEGYTPSSEADAPLSEKYVTSPDYFRTLGIPLLKGRAFSDSDVAGSRPVIIINEGMANRFWPGEDPIGKRVKFGWLNEDWQDVVGVVGDVKNETLARAVPLETYLCYRQAPLSQMSIMVKTKGEPLSAVSAVRAQILSVDRDQPVYNINTLERVVAGSASTDRSLTFILLLFASLALVLAAVGIYGVISYWVTQRTREIGTRMALGARRSDVLRMVVGQGAKVILVGVGVGLVGAFGLTRLMTSLLFAVSPGDPLVFAAISVILILTGLLASYIPALRATRVDPMTALRYE